ncbi:hypothetical protein SAMN05216360_113123 [Methylobacterium phyllostachyos]|uniref:Uncharacterized protein n=1 Tax=Methylobacterium phyllostachyos TaxID=582672 RepID=A0A1H0FVW6_9HYPH|nr:hypothetical protein [Methylobacterium phyllostachyos]SDN98765.1 hypothetical protein SAMN05216360_113123 [Methylobacterium phyllostachyos]
MTTRLRLALFCALVSLPTSARAQAALRLEGTCEKLVIGTQDLSASCSKVLTNAVSRNRTSFDFTTTDGQVISFSGNGAQQEATEETDPLQPINVVSIGKDAAPTLAIGACRFSTPEPGRTAITCEASAADGRAFAGTFVTATKAAAGAPAATPAR